jgi:hypothetical protein
MLKCQKADADGPAGLIPGPSLGPAFDDHRPEYAAPWIPGPRPGRTRRGCDSAAAAIAGPLLDMRTRRSMTSGNTNQWATPLVSPRAPAPGFHRSTWSERLAVDRTAASRSKNPAPEPCAPWPLTPGCKQSNVPPSRGFDPIALSPCSDEAKLGVLGRQDPCRGGEPLPRERQHHLAAARGGSHQQLAQRHTRGVGRGRTDRQARR